MTKRLVHRRLRGWWVLLGMFLVAGCAEREVVYGIERQLSLPETRPAVWAVAPAVNLSGERVDPILQADILFQQLQSVHGITAVPVNRTAEVFATLRIERVQSSEQADLVCQLLGVDALIVPTVTIYHPYNPPRMGASLALFRLGSSERATLDARALTRAASEREVAMPRSGFRQASGMFDSTNGTVRDAVERYASGRFDPLGPMGHREYYHSADRFAGFVYHELLRDLLAQLQER